MSVLPTNCDTWRAGEAQAGQGTVGNLSFIDPYQGSGKKEPDLFQNVLS